MGTTTQSAWASRKQGNVVRRTDPLVVWLVDVLVHAGVMLEAMDPVDGNIIERHVQQRRDHQPGPAIVAHGAIKQALATDLRQEPGQGQNVDDGYGGYRRFDLLTDLVGQEARMVLEAAVKYEVVGEGAEEEVEGRCADLCEDQQRDYLPINIVARPSRRRVGEGGVGGQQPGIGFVQDEGIEELESDIHGR